MKLLVFFRYARPYRASARRIAAPPGRRRAVFFGATACGDIEELEETHPALRVYAVRGNCDYASFAPQDGLAAFDNVLFYYTHGHLLGVKAGYEQLYFAAKSRGADVALFGHTHRAFCEEWDGVTLFNPGTLSYPDASYGGDRACKRQAHVPDRAFVKKAQPCGCAFFAPCPGKTPGKGSAPVRRAQGR